MAYATMRMDGKEFVLVPKVEFGRLTAQDRRDAKKLSGLLRSFAPASSEPSLMPP